MKFNKAIIFGIAVALLLFGENVNADYECAGDSYACRLIGSTAYCWGKASHAGMYRLSSESSSDDFAGDYPYEKARPILVPNVIEIWCLPASLFLKRADGSIVAHGLNYDGMMAIGQRDDFGSGSIQDGWLQANKITLENITMKMLNATENYVALKVTGSYSYQCTMFSTVNGLKVKCHGINNFYQLGRAGSNSPPAATGNDIPYVQLGGKDLKVENVVHSDKFGCGNSHCCAVAESPTTPNEYNLYCWGSGSVLGLGTNVDVSTPTKVNLKVNTDNNYAKYPICNSIRMLTVAYTTTCIQCDDYKIRCWGYNAYWKLGIPEIEYVSSDTGYFGDELSEMGPDRVPIPIDFGLTYGNAVNDWAIGPDYTCALSSLGLKCWSTETRFTGLPLPSGRYNTTQSGWIGMGTDLPAILNTSMAYTVMGGNNIVCFRTLTLVGSDTRCWGSRHVTGGGDWYSGAPGSFDNDYFAGDNYRPGMGFVTNDSFTDLKPVQFGASLVSKLSMVTVALVMACVSFIQ